MQTDTTIQIPDGVTVREVGFYKRPTIVVDDESMAARVRTLNPQVEIRVQNMIIPAAKDQTPVWLSGHDWAPVNNRHERRRRAALARKGKR
jgi:hypothetical protein